MTAEKVKPQVDGASETLLISLWSRAQVIDRDRKAKELISRIDYDFSRFNKWKRLLNYTVARTDIFDTVVASFIASHPDAVIVNIGAGLDTRFFRVDNGQVLWYDLDLPNVIGLRKQFFEETERNRFIAASVTDEHWVDVIQEKNRPILFIAEGVLMYLDVEAVKQFFCLVTEYFPTAELVFEVVGPFFLPFKHPLVYTTDSNPSLKWGVWNVKELEHWNRHLKIYKIYEPKTSVLSLVISKIVGNKIVHVRFVP